MRSILVVTILLFAAVLHSRAKQPMERPDPQKGRSLFLKNCAHCHANDATGDEGPDLHSLKHSDGWIEKRIRDGIKGEMPAFREKFKDGEIESLIQFLRTLK